MENNSYPRFLESEFYQDLCKKPQITTEPHAT
uniref:RGS2 protein n=5 Tax=Boreoeutheria TaxID=1437010 RepID=Q49A86_HUMAN|nr:RGS2 protein [Homo sapiens]